MTNQPNNSEKYDIFLSYRRDGGEMMAILLRDRLSAKGYRVFLDIESLKSGSFNKKLLSVIESCTDVIFVCSKNSLDRCSNEGDWVRIEISHALQHGKNVVPFIMRDFEWPDTLPDDIDALRMQNGVNAGSNEYFDAVIDRLADSFLKSVPKTVPQNDAAEKLESSKKTIIGNKIGILAATIFIVVLVALATGRISFWEKKSEENINVNINDNIEVGINPTKETTVTPVTQPSLPAVPKIEYVTIKGNQYSVSLFELDLCNIDLTNGEIAPLQYMTNLKILNLGGNQISDLKPLSNLTNLTHLSLYDNKQIYDLRPLSNLTNLARLSLYYNQISDLTPLSKLANLEWLELSGNQISDLKPLKNLTKLKYLGLKENKIEDWSPVAHIPNVNGRP